MHRHFWRLSEHLKTFYNWSRSSFQSSVLWSVASGLYGRIHSLPRYASIEPATGVPVSSHRVFRLFLPLLQHAVRVHPSRTML
jgi:hypothetical protein